MCLNNSKFISTNHKNNIEIRLPNSKKSFFIKDETYYAELAELVEIIKVEGYCNSNGNISIDNKDLPLSNFFEKLLLAHEIVPGKRKLIKIKLEEIDKHTIVIYENGQSRTFHIEKGFKSNKPNKIVFSTGKQNSNISVFQNNKHILSFNLKEKNLASKAVSKYFTLKFSNKTLANYMRLKLNESFGFDTIRVNKLLINSNSSIITKVFGVLVDCEGSIRFNKKSKHYRTINIRMKNELYLSDWKRLLKKININSNLRKEKDLWKLTITCNQNFKKLHDLGFELHHSKKRTRFKEMLNSYQKHQVERNTALNYYEKLVEDNPGRSALELSRASNKNKRTVSHYLIRLFNLNILRRQLVTKQKFIYYPK